MHPSAHMAGKLRQDIVHEIALSVGILERG